LTFAATLLEIVARSRADVQQATDEVIEQLVR
jgi:hypothetical protein